MSSDEEQPVGLNRFDDDDHSDDEYYPAHDHHSPGEDEDEASDSLEVDQDMEEESEGDDDNDGEGIQLNISGTFDYNATHFLIYRAYFHTANAPLDPATAVDDRNTLINLLRRYGSLVRSRQPDPPVESSSDEEQDPAQVLSHSRPGHAAIIVLTPSSV